MSNRTSELPLTVSVDGEHIQHIVNVNEGLDTEKDKRVSLETLKNFYLDGVPTDASVNGQINTALSGYVTTTFYNANKLVAGNGIVISGNVISVTGGTGSVSGSTFDTSLDYYFTGRHTHSEPLKILSPLSFIETSYTSTGETFSLGFMDISPTTGLVGKSAYFGINEDDNAFLEIDGKQLIWTQSGYINFSGGTGSLSAVTWSQITNKPTTISGYGITDAYTKNEVNNLVAYSGGTGISVTGNTINLNISANDPATTGIYQGIDVNNNFATNLAFDSLTEESAGGLQATDNFAFTRSGLIRRFRYAYLRNQLNQQILLNYVASGNTGNIQSTDSLNTALNKLQNAIVTGNTALSGYVTTNTIQTLPSGVKKYFDGSAFNIELGSDIVRINDKSLAGRNARLFSTQLSFNPATGATSQDWSNFSNTGLQFYKTNQSNSSVSGGINLTPENVLNLQSSATTVTANLTLPFENGTLATREYVQTRISGLTGTSSSVSAVTWSQITNTPTTLSGYGITNAYTTGQTNTLLAGYSLSSHTHSFNQITNKPTTLSGYGITDAYTTGQTINLLNGYSLSSHTHSLSQLTNTGHTHTWNQITNTPTTLSGYGISGSTVLRTPSLIDLYNTQIFSDDLLTFVNWETGGSGNGRTLTTQSGYQGIHVLQTGTGTSGRVYSKLNNNFSANSIVIGSKRLEQLYSFYIPVLSTSANTFSVRVGLINTDVAASTSRGIFAEYTDNQNNGNWRIGAGSGSTVYTNTSLVVSAATWYTLLLDITSSLATVTLINQTTNATSTTSINTNLPIGTTLAVQPYFVLEKSSGGNNIELWCDHYAHRFSFG
jgi:hypothetical protein